jgi:hypothetical protein
MKAQVTDAELVEVLKMVEEAGGISQAARKYGRNRSHLNQLHAAAKARGLTAKSKVLDEKAKLSAALALANKRIEMIQKDNDTAESIRKEIYNLSARSPEAPAWLVKSGHAGSRGAPCMIWSDWHCGEVVVPEEVAGVNEFNRLAARGRVKTLVDVTIDLSYNHMGRAKTVYPGAIVMLGGDMITGDIHDELIATNDRTVQQSINDLTDVLGSALDTMAAKFGKLFVPCVVGNHGRSTRKPRMKGRVYTSFEWNIYCNLERHFRGSKHIQFLIPGETDAYFSVFGHRYLLTHGDALGVKGGDGIIGAMGPIMRGSIKVGRSEAQLKRDFDTIVMGHWHQYLTFPGVIVNNSLIGYNEYARLGLRAPYSRPSQALWFTHPEHGITAHWQVYLESLKTAQDTSQWVSWQERKAA